MVQSVVDIEATVKQLMEYERQKKLVALQDKKQSYQSAKKALSDVDSSLEDLEDMFKVLTKEATFKAREASSSNTYVASASSAVGASEILFDLEVTQLATSATVSSDNLIGLISGTSTTMTSTAELNTTGGQAADANQRFDTGTPNLDTAVTAGNFTINNTTITVLASDTINLVLSKINASGAGVTAEYDSVNDKIVITHDTPGSSSEITIADGSSNFVTAMKLNTATDVNGEDDYLYQDLADIPSVGVTDGYFTINNITFRVDAANDSVHDIINRINSSAAGVSIFYSQDTDKITMISDVEGENIEMSNDSSGFLSAMNILDISGDGDATAGESTYAFTKGSVVVNGSTISIDSNSFTLNGTTFNVISTGTAQVDVSFDKSVAVDVISDFVAQYNKTNALIEEKLNSQDGALKDYRALKSLQRALKQRMYSAITNTGEFDRLSEIGITFQRTKGEGLAKLQLDENKLNEAFATSQESVFKIFAYDSDDDGLYDDGGFANTTYDYIHDYTRNVLGIFDQRDDFLYSASDRLDRKIWDEEKRLFDLELKLTQSYQLLNNALSKMDAQIQKLNNLSFFNN